MRIVTLGGQAQITLESTQEVEDFLDILGPDYDVSSPMRAELASKLYATLPPSPGQETLFDSDAPIVTAPTDEPPGDLAEWARGQEAGYRGDELLGGYSADYLRGYDEGRASRAEYERRYKTNG